LSSAAANSNSHSGRWRAAFAARLALVFLLAHINAVIQALSGRTKSVLKSIESSAYRHCRVAAYHFDEWDA
jgi:hypothetical protein